MLLFFIALLARIGRNNSEEFCFVATKVCELQTCMTVKSPDDEFYNTLKIFLFEGSILDSKNLQKEF